MDICFTVDVEQDCPPFLETFAGIEHGLPYLLQILRQERVPATFYVTGEVARRFPAMVERILKDGHELGCHGDTHRRFSKLSREEAETEIHNATTTLRRFAPTKSFRAPNLDFPKKYLALLEQAGYQTDSSQALYKSDEKGAPYLSPITRIPVSMTSSVLRLPKAIRYPIFKFLKEPVVLFVHPWEFIDLSRSGLRWDCRFRTGAKALSCLHENIQYFKNRGFQFKRIIDLAAIEGPLPSPQKF